MMVLVNSRATIDEEFSRGDDSSWSVAAWRWQRPCGGACSPLGPRPPAAPRPLHQRAQVAVGAAARRRRGWGAKLLLNVSRRLFRSWRRPPPPCSRATTPMAATATTAAPPHPRPSTLRPAPPRCVMGHLGVSRGGAVRAQVGAVGVGAADGGRGVRAGGRVGVEGAAHPVSVCARPAGRHWKGGGAGRGCGRVIASAEAPPPPCSTPSRPPNRPRLALPPDAVLFAALAYETGRGGPVQMLGSRSARPAYTMGWARPGLRRQKCPASAGLGWPPAAIDATRATMCVSPLEPT